MADGNGDIKMILKAELIDKKIVITNYTNYIPMLDYIKGELDYIVMELRAIERPKQEGKISQLYETILPNILDRIRGKK